MTDLLADENFPLDSVDYLQNLGYNIKSIIKSNPGISDEEVVEIGNKEKRLILTFDRDFGRLAFKDRIIPKSGVVYFRIEGFKPDYPGKILHEILESKNYKPEGSIIVIERDFVCQKKF